MAFYKYIKPTLYASSIQDIPYEQLKKQGIHTLFFDLDNTVMSYGETLISNEIIQFLNDLKATFKIMIVSNSGFKRVSKASNHAKLEFIHSAKKPLKIGYKKALKKAACTKDKVVFIGDQLMTDIYGANKMNIVSVLVKPVKQRSDHFFTRTNRKIERFVIKKMFKKHSNLVTDALKAYAKDIHGL
jgi:HAD superfamily phosphatase (TIGR01668 family)